ncbi:hypothetical protein PIB30_064944 [Stylosanthes scabra]|uniref:Uncharacterized protein n=1 Tax=Stylosanthes scabra TaxID=79078 RepID=A0ABU6YME5_9FABA|nr:hypothetical protein [Stylosanthes scabra]
MNREPINIISGARGVESSRVAQSEVTGNAGGSNKGESETGFASGVKERNTRVDKVKISFRDKVVGTMEAKIMSLDADLFDDRLATITDREQHDLHPKVSFSAEVKASLTEPYKNTVVIKVLGKHFSYKAIVQ